MPTLTVTAKGQITLRQNLLQHLGIRPGAKISIRMLPDHSIKIEAVKPKSKISDIFGLLKREDRTPVSIEEMNAAIADGWAEKRERHR